MTDLTAQHHLVTGGAGFLGRHLVARLVAAGATVTTVDDGSSPGSMAEAIRTTPRVHRVVEDVIDWVERELRDPFVGHTHYHGIWHLASPASPPLYKRRRRETLRLGAHATDRLLTLAQLHGTRFLLASSSEVYGDPPAEAVPTPESYRGHVSTTGPRSCYDEAKRAAEAVCAAWDHETDVEVRIARIHNTYGPGQEPDGRLMPALIRAALTGAAPLIDGNGHQTRSVAYVDDTIAGLLAVWELGSSQPVNVGGGEELAVIEIARRVHEALGCRMEGWRIGGRCPDDPRRRCPDLTRLRGLGWTQQVGLEEGVRRTARWVLAQAADR